MWRSAWTTKDCSAETDSGSLERVDDAIQWGRGRLRPSHTAALDAQLLLAQVLGRPRVWVLSHPDTSLDEEQRSAYAALVERRAAGEPVAYLRGWVEWYGLRIGVTRDVLVPRPETELLLEKAAELASQYGWRSIADIGTGSGAIAVGLAVLLPDARIQASDINSEALAVARINAERHGVAARVTFLEGDLIEPVLEPPELIVANLPYLSDDMMASLDRDVRQEPAAALYGGPDGLSLLGRLRDELDVRGWRVPLLLEIDPRQSEAARALFGQYGRVEILRDYAGHDRIVWVEPERR